MRLIAIEIGKDIFQTDSREDLPAMPKLAVTVCLLKQPIVQPSVQPSASLTLALTKRHGPLSNSSTLKASRSVSGL